MSNISPNLAFALNKFISWYEDNLFEEEWLDTEDTTDGNDGTWKSYSEIPEYKDLISAVKRLKKK